MSSKVQEILAKVEELTEAERAELLVRLRRTAREDQQQESGSKPRTLFDAFNERGMIGSITDAPPDWSTNPKYMEGFGQHDAE